MFYLTEVYKDGFQLIGTMPALKMKRRAVSSCANEGSFMSVCRDSSMIFKRERSVAMDSHDTHLEMTKACQSGGPCLFADFHSVPCFPPTANRKLNIFLIFNFLFKLCFWYWRSYLSIWISCRTF